MICFPFPANSAFRAHFLEAIHTIKISYNCQFLSFNALGAKNTARGHILIGTYIFSFAYIFQLEVFRGSDVHVTLPDIFSRVWHYLTCSLVQGCSITWWKEIAWVQYSSTLNLIRCKYMSKIYHVSTTLCHERLHSNSGFRHTSWTSNLVPP